MGYDRMNDLSDLLRFKKSADIAGFLGKTKFQQS